MQACQSYQACPICLHAWSPGALIRRTHCIYDGARCFLAPGSRARQRRFRRKGQTYEYRCVETRPKPKYRDDEFVKSAVALATNAQPFCGHKPVVPLLAMWPGWSWRRTNQPEPMHGSSHAQLHLHLHRHQPMCVTDSKNACDNVMTLMIGKRGEGKYSNWSKDSSHRRHCKALGVFSELWPADRPEADSTPNPAPKPAPFPWRLTAAQIKLLSQRTKNIIWPHHMERMYYRGASMWEKPSRMLKCRRKYRLLFHVLPVQLRDQVPQLREAIVKFAWTMRRLDGQVYSYDAAIKLGILPGSRVLVRGEIKVLHKDMICALVMLEGSFPIGHLIPTWHHFVHYVEFTVTHGVLRWLWMMAFERFVCFFLFYYCLSCTTLFHTYPHIHRYNKYLKNLVRDPHRPTINLANSASQDVSARFSNFVGQPLYDLSKDPRHICFLFGQEFNLPVMQQLVGDLLVLRSRVYDRNSCVGFPSANIMGVKFNAGEWPTYPRCGSVITCLMGKDEHEGVRSLFARVNHFFKVIDDDNCGYASVSWFGEPSYLYPDNPLGARCKEDGSVLGRKYGNVIKITQIDPTPIMVEHDRSNNTYIMIRDSGYSTRRT